MKNHNLYEVEVQQVVRALYRFNAESELEARLILLQNLKESERSTTSCEWSEPEVIGVRLAAGGNNE